MDKHLRILSQGVASWNRWRNENPHIIPTLIRADLREAYLSRANLAKANLREALLTDTFLNVADLRGANLSEADLHGANLSEANLSEADLSRADLRGAKLRSAKLCSAKLSGANLSGVSLRKADLRGANLSKADLSNSDLSLANVSKANLSNASLQTSRLINTKLDEADLTDTCLWETQRAGWSIKGVICESVYWDKDAEVKTVYNPTDFERLFADKTRIRLFFKDGITPLEIATLPALIKHLEEAHPGCSLRLVSIHDDAGGAVVELAVENDNEQSRHQLKQLQTALEAEAQQRIEYQRQALIEREARLQLEGEVKQLDSVVDKLICQHKINIYEKGSMKNKFTISGQAGAVGPNAHAHDMTFNQLVNQVEQTVDLDALARELSELRESITEKQDGSPQAAVAIGRVADAELAATEKDTPKVVEHLKAAGEWTLDFAKAIGKDVVVAAIKQSMGMP